eukprot:TRINITY_DN90623_c0_g1_i1.p1 TRINITY_DN90623_c0_g1~~TRINITY_DN90623_c0_g1_i1.p1  ORF type:complete len:444 (-),score=71.91 TRINITY_DN90623_c0_g1_i1:101-1432(-)
MEGPISRFFEAEGLSRRQRAWPCTTCCGLNLLLASMAGIFFSAGLELHLQLVRGRLDQELRHLDCSDSMGASPGPVFLAGCKLAADLPMKMNATGFGEVLAQSASKNVIWKEMRLQHRNPDKPEGSDAWDDVKADGSARHMFQEVKSARLGSYRLSRDLIYNWPGQRVRLQTPKWQKDGLDQPQKRTENGTQIFNSSTMYVDEDKHTLEAGDTRIWFEAAFEGVYSAVVELNEESTLSQVQTHDDWVKPFVRIVNGSQRLDSVMGDKLRKRSTTRSDCLLASFFMWMFLWPDVAGIQNCCSGLCSSYGLSTLLRSSVLAVLGVEFWSWACWLYFHAGPFISVATIGGTVAALAGAYYVYPRASQGQGSAPADQQEEGNSHLMGDPSGNELPVLTPSTTLPSASFTSDARKVHYCLLLIAFFIFLVAANLAISALLGGRGIRVR